MVEPLTAEDLDVLCLRVLRYINDIVEMQLRDRRHHDIYQHNIDEGKKLLDKLSGMKDVLRSGTEASKGRATILAKVIIDHNENGYSLQGACQHNDIGYEEFLEMLKGSIRVTLPIDGIVLVEERR